MEVYVEHLLGAGEGNIHYVANISIYRNDILVQIHNYTSQPNDYLTFYYTINATHMDVLTVTAKCNIGGELTKSITVYDPSKPTTLDSSTITPLLSSFRILPTLITIIFFTSLSLIFQIKNKEKIKKPN